MEKAISRLGGDARGGMIVPTDSFMTVHRMSHISLSKKYKVPTVYFSALIVLDGGLICYTVNADDLLRRAAPYVDRILRGQTPAELPVQLPTKFELVVNMKTARELGIAIPYAVMLRADKVIE